MTLALLLTAFVALAFRLIAGPLPRKLWYFFTVTLPMRRWSR